MDASQSYVADRFKLGRAFGAHPTIALASWFRKLGHTCLTLQSDGEPAIQSLVDSVRAKLTAELAAGAGGGHIIDRAAVQTSPVDSHASNGAVERAVQAAR